MTRRMKVMTSAEIDAQLDEALADAPATKVSYSPTRYRLLGFVVGLTVIASVYYVLFG